MGWSCSAVAGDVMTKWTAACVAQTGSQNVYEIKGQKYFWDISRKEHDDGAITGTIFKMLPENRAQKCGSFRINGDGTIARAPSFLKAALG